MTQDHLAASVPACQSIARLAAFAGEWNGEEVVFPSRWTEGGPATCACRRAHGPQRLLSDPGLRSRSATASRVFATHGIFTYDREDRTYKLFWYDSLGYTPPSPASGGWVGKTLTLVRGSLRGNARHVYEIIDDNSYSLKIQFSPDAEGWADVLTGIYRRIH